MTLTPIKYLFFDWGDTLMEDYPQYTGPMYTWPRISAMEGVAQLMPGLSQKYKCVVLSNAVESNGELMKKAFERAELAEYFQRFFTSKELNASKPERQFFTRAMEMVNAEAHEVMMIGNDYNKDIISAKAAGMSTVLISSKAGEYLCADYMVEDFRGLGLLL